MTLTIGHLHHRFLVAEQAQLPRLQAIAALLPAALSAELDRHRADPAVVICFRRLHSRYRAEDTDLDSPAAQARRWAADIAAAVADGPPARGTAAGWANDDDAPVLLFANEHAVAADVLLRTGAGDLRHRWAWEMASVVAPTDPADPARLAAAVLARYPRLLSAGLRTLLHGPAGVPLHWTWSTWLALAAGASTVPVPQDLRHTAPAGRADRLLAAPDYVRLLALVRRSLAGGQAPDAGQAPAPRTGVPAVAALLVAAAAPELAGDRMAIAAAQAQVLAEASVDGNGDGGAAVPAGTGGTDRPAGPRRSALADPPGEEPVTALPVAPETEGQQPARTTAGGLPFLLHLVVRLDLPARLTGTAWAGASNPFDPARELRGRPLTAVLGELGRLLAACAPADPALLAFLGRLPGDELPEAPLYSAAENAALEQLMGEVDHLLESLLPGPAAERGRALRPWVINRPAGVTGTSGWIEVVFRADHADTDLRKAGLDLDPGFLPILGSVVRFRYV